MLKRSQCMKEFKDKCIHICTRLGANESIKFSGNLGSEKSRDRVSLLGTSMKVV